MLKIGSQPISCDGAEALQAITHGLTKQAKRPVDPSSLKVRIKHPTGEYTDLSDGDVLELSANVALPKQPARKAKAPAKSST